MHQVALKTIRNRALRKHLIRRAKGKKHFLHILFFSTLPRPRVLIIMMIHYFIVILIIFRFLSHSSHFITAKEEGERRRAVSYEANTQMCSCFQSQGLLKPVHEQAVFIFPFSRFLHFSFPSLLSSGCALSLSLPLQNLRISQIHQLS